MLMWRNLRLSSGKEVVVIYYGSRDAVWVELPPYWGPARVFTAVKEGWLEPEEAEEIKMFALEKLLDEQ